MNHESEAVLHALEAMITEVDLELWQWQSDIDVLALAGVEIPLILHKDGEAIGIGEARLIHDDGALVMTGENVVAPNAFNHAAFRYLRSDMKPYFDEPRDPLPLVMYKDGKRIEVGFAEYTVLPNGDIVARGEVTAHIPELHEPLPAFSIAESGFPPFEGLSKPLTVRGLEKIIEHDEEKQNRLQKIRESIPEFNKTDFENHPFFKKE